ncbi:MAG: 23S rRNA (pseudouridine(1915)-N(3))-methyltransferase RlmH [Bacteroidaceae bacterium]|nr:23S rRNA (pseudouridine(1915)-N(3))-methyltransferase RlmH [Bacteroidaceae bacterium]
MKIQFIVVGKTAQSYLVDSIADYTTRLRRYITFDMEVIPELKNTRNLTTEQQKEREGEAILKVLQPGDFVVLLDEHGQELTSVQFARYIEQKMQTVSRRLVFIVGGPYGFAKSVYDRCNDKLSLSKMTFSHQMVRLFFTEQLYRAMTILNNEPYHHE